VCLIQKYRFPTIEPIERQEFYDDESIGMQENNPYEEKMPLDQEADILGQAEFLHNQSNDCAFKFTSRIFVEA